MSGPVVIFTGVWFVIMGAFAWATTYYKNRQGNAWRPSRLQEWLERTGLAAPESYYRALAWPLGLIFVGIGVGLVVMGILV